MKSFMTLNIINFADVAWREKDVVLWDEESFITMKLIWHGYLVSSLYICVHEIPTETGLREKYCCWLPGEHSVSGRRYTR